MTTKAEMTGERAIEVLRWLSDDAACPPLPKWRQAMEKGIDAITRDGELRERLAKLAASWKHERGGEPRKFCLVLHATQERNRIEAVIVHGCEAYRGPTCDACRAMDDAANELLAAMEETSDGR